MIEWGKEANRTLCTVRLSSLNSFRHGKHKIALESYPTFCSGVPFNIRGYRNAESGMENKSGRQKTEETEYFVVSLLSVIFLLRTKLSSSVTLPLS